MASHAREGLVEVAHPAFGGTVSARRWSTWLLLALALLWSAAASAQVADLAITKDDGSDTYAPGGSVSYTIVVSNNGPADVLDAVVDDPLPAGISAGTWTCTAGGAVACDQAAGVGGINTTVDLPAGGQVTFTHNISVPAGFGDPLVNTATVSTPAGTIDPVQANNSATDTNLPGADVSVTKSATPASVRTGEVVSYTITVANAGPADAGDVTLGDTPGAGLDCTTPSPTATCSASGGAACPGIITVAALTGAGVVIPSLPAGDQVQVTLQCTVTASGQ